SGAMMEFESKDGDGENVHQSKMVVSKIYSEGDVTVADVKSSDNMGNEFTMQYKCADDKLYMDFAAAIEEAMKKSGQDGASSEDIQKVRENTEMNFSDGFMSFPKNMYPGQTLDDVTFSLKTSTSPNLSMEVVSTLLDRKVEKKEQVTTPAGTFDCLKISGKRSTSMKIMGMNKNMGDPSVDYLWFAPGIGVIKQESYNGKGKLESSTQLKAYKL